MANRIELDIDKISELYESGLSCPEISQIVGARPLLISRRLRENGIVMRNNSESHSLKNGTIIGKNTYRNKDWLYNQYHVLEKSQAKIGKEIGTHQVVIHEWMDRLGIPSRSISDSAAINVSHINYTSELNDVLSGLLLGDGHLASYSNLSARYEHSDKHESYAIYLDKLLNGFGIAKSGKIIKRTGKTSGHEFTSYSITTKNYSELLNEQKRWYENRIKIVPTDIVLSPTVCLHWFIGDGCLSTPNRGRKFIVLYTNGFNNKEVPFLINSLNGVGIKSTHMIKENAIRINPDNAIKFLCYIGPAPKEIYCAYGYKWSMTKSKKEWEAKFGI